MKQLYEKHPLAIRWFHWVNFPLLTLMIWSGLLIYWANDVYRIGWGDTTLLKFFPKSFYQALHVPFRLAEGMALHFFFMWLFAINGVLYVLYTAISGEWRHLLPSRHSLHDAVYVTLYDLGLRKTAPLQGKYNGAQKIAYTLVIIMGVGSLLTGIAIYKPTQFASLTTALGGYAWARAEHFILTIGYVVFFVIHVAQVVRAGWNNFRSMIAGVGVINGPTPVTRETAKAE